MNKEILVNYVAIKEGLLLPEPNKVGLNGLLSIGLEHASGLIKCKALTIVGQITQPEEFNRYLAGIVFGRIIQLNNEAIKKGISGTDSRMLFEELEKTIYSKLSFSKESLTKERLNNLLEKSVDLFYEGKTTTEISSNMDLIRKLASKVVPDNVKRGEIDLEPTWPED